MNILFIHPSFPAQFRNLASILASNPEHTVLFATTEEENEITGVQKLYYDPQHIPSNASEYPGYLFEQAMAHANGVYSLLKQLLNNGIKPDVIYAHSGFGVAHFVKLVLPDVPLIGYFEWMYNNAPNIFNLEIESPSLSYVQRVKSRDASTLLDLNEVDIAVTPTEFQKSKFPEVFHNKIQVVHDGIHTEFFKPDNSDQTHDRLNDLNITIPEGAQIVTYVSRGLEPLRGFPVFVEAMEKVLIENPNIHVLVVGSEKPHYASNIEDGKTYKQFMLEKYDLPERRIHFTGLLALDEYRDILNISDVHIYLTRPYVLSWSMLEAMASGCTLICSDTAPVREFIEDQQNGLLVSLNNADEIANKVLTVMNDLDNHKKLGVKARKTIKDTCSLKKQIRHQLRLVLGAGLGKLSELI